MVHEAITPGFIEFIDYPTCPVTLVELTHSTGADSDWSVDCVNNDGAYADGNLVVMSARANKTKGNRRLADVSELTAELECLPGLSLQETRRLRSLMEGPCTAGHIGERSNNILWTRLCRGTGRTNYQNLQHILVTATAVSSAKRNAMFRTLLFAHTDARASEALLNLAYEKLVKAIKSGSYEYDACGDHDFQKLLRRWVDIIPSTRKTDVHAKLESLTGGRGVPKETLRTWALETKGLYARW